MKQFILSIIGAVMLTVISSLVLPDGKMNRYIKGVLSIFTIIVILTPIIKLSKNEIDIWNSEEITLQSEYLDYINSRVSEYYCKECESLLYSMGYQTDVEIEYTSSDAFEIKKVLVNFDNSGIYDKDEHIVIVSKIKESIKNYLSIDVEQISVNGD